MHPAPEESIDWVSGGKRGLDRRGSEISCSQQASPSSPPHPPPPQPPQGCPLGQGWGPGQTVLLPSFLWGLTPRQNSLCLALPPFSSSPWPGSQVALTFLGLASRPESVCLSEAGVIPGPGLVVSSLMWPLWPGRVINAGKSRHNEDQACCEVVYVEGRRSGSGAPREPGPGQVSPQRPPEAARHLCPGVPSIRF